MESPNKVCSVAGYLDPESDVKASVGHIHDLPQSSELFVTMKESPYGKLTVDIENDFIPYCVVSSDREKMAVQFKKVLEEAGELHLATDDDCEGEVIAWHLQQVLEPKVPVRRMVFTGIIYETVIRTLGSTRELDIHLVDTQETRRILDRLMDYEVSPVLWRKVRADLSARRVQSMATCLVVEYKHECMVFRPVPYWEVEITFSTVLSAVDVTVRQEASFTARPATLNERCAATSHDSNGNGQLRLAALKASIAHLHQVGATVVAEAIGWGEPCAIGVENKPYKRRPAIPLTTPILQQEVSRRLCINSYETMRAAQGLHENGFITYMRVDSMVLSGQAMIVVRSQVTELCGAEYIPERPRAYAFESKGAQEAHETTCSADDHFHTPAQASGEPAGAQFRLYELIQKRIATPQMADAAGSTATVAVEASLTPVTGESHDPGPTFSTAGLTTSGTVITFRGFLVICEEGCDVGCYQDDTNTAVKDFKGVYLPAIITGQELAALDAEISGHETIPPPCYTEVSLAKAFEKYEIGRPPTYAATMSTISDRGYVNHRSQALVPTWFVFAVTRLLEENFVEPVGYSSTAPVKRGLDRIATGEEDWVAWLWRSYNGQGEAGTGQAAQTALNELEAATAALCAQGSKGLVDNLGEIDARAVDLTEIGEGITLRVRRYNPYPEDAEGKHASVPIDLVPDGLTVDKTRELFIRVADNGRELGVDPASGYVIIAEDGRYNPYVAEILSKFEETVEIETTKTMKTAKPMKAKRTTKVAKTAKPRTVSLLRSMDLPTVTLEQALDLLNLSHIIDQDPESRENITAQNGCYGPYPRKGTDSRPLETEEQIFTVTLGQALEILAQPKQHRGQAAARGSLRGLGQDPATKKPVVIKDGRFNPYITNRQTGVTVPHSEDPATISAERASELPADKRVKGPTRERTTHKTTSKRATTKKTTTKKAATIRKTTAQITTSKVAASKEG